MLKNKKVIIWDLDNTLYRITPEFADKLDEAMAQANTWLYDTVYAAMRTFGDGYYSVARRICREKLKEAEAVLLGSLRDPEDPCDPPAR